MYYQNTAAGKRRLPVNVDSRVALPGLTFGGHCAILNACIYGYQYVVWKTICLILHNVHEKCGLNDL